MSRKSSFLCLALGCALLSPGLSLAAPAHTAADPAAQELAAELAQVGPAKFTAADYRPGIVRHVVLIHLKDSLSATQRQSLIKQFLALQSTSLRDGKPVITSIETGPQNSGEGASRGLQQGFIVSFASQGDRNYFIGKPVVTDPRYYDPAHDAFKKVLGPALADQGLVGFDFPVQSKTP